jgi:hypothetical protein
MRVTSLLLSLFIIAGSRMAPAATAPDQRSSTSFAKSIQPLSVTRLFIGMKWLPISIW